MDDLTYEVWYRLNIAWRFMIAWRPHHLWCAARQFRAANGVVTLYDGPVTFAACKCGLGRAYDTTAMVSAGDLFRCDAFSRL